MNTSYWERKDGTAFNWREVPGGTIWEVKPTATTLLSPPTGGPTRNSNTIKTKCLYSDFNLQFDFRCPNMRSVWTDCNSAVKGPENWGNSGVKIFDLNGYEVQILDSHGATDTGGDVTNLNSCHMGGSNPVNTFEICGALYKYRAPDSNPVQAASNAAGGDFVPNGAWNHMEIGFMAARYNWEEKLDHDLNPVWQWVKKKCATITVKITGAGATQRVHHHVGLNPQSSYDETADLVCDTAYDTEEDQKGWCKARGPIFLQEHDSKVQFKGITINPSWLPKDAGVFNENWQQSSGCLTRS